MATGADLLVSELKRQGVTWVSTLCGNGLNPFYAACRKAGIRLVDTHNEQAAAYMADAYARLTGRVGVCAVSSGIAHVNALTGVANAFFDGAPLLLLTSASAGYGAGRGVFQEFDQVAMAKPICKFSRCVTRVSGLTYLVRQAFTSAASGHLGPVHLTVPIDVLEAEADEPEKPLKGGWDGVVSPGKPEYNVLDGVIRAIKRSERPLIVAGTGVFYARAGAAMLRFSEASAVPIVTPIWDRGAVDKPHPNFLGVVGAATGEPRLLEDADLIIMAGAAVDYRVGFLAPPKVKKDAAIIRVDSDPNMLGQGVEPDMALSASPSLVFDQLAKASTPRLKAMHAKWLEEARERSRRFRARWVEENPPDTPTSGWHIVKAIQRLLTEDTVFLIDGGNIGQWAHMVLAADRYPGHWLTCGASAVVGWGIPGAMAARLVYPDRRVLLLSGDGSFGFTVAELESAVRQKLPFVAVVANDCAWGIVVSGQLSQCGEEGVTASRFGAIRYDRVAEAFGAIGVHIDDIDDLPSAIEDGFSAGRPTVIDVPISVCGPADVK